MLSLRQKLQAIYGYLPQSSSCSSLPGLILLIINIQSTECPKPCRIEAGCSEQYSFTWENEHIQDEEDDKTISIFIVIIYFLYFICRHKHSDYLCLLVLLQSHSTIMQFIYVNHKYFYLSYLVLKLQDCNVDCDIEYFFTSQSFYNQTVFMMENVCVVYSVGFFHPNSLEETAMFSTIAFASCYQGIKSSI